jgi:hypothetical protein
MLENKEVEIKELNNVINKYGREIEIWKENYEKMENVFKNQNVQFEETESENSHLKK